MIYTERQFEYCIDEIDPPVIKKKKTLKSNWQKIVVTRIHENGYGKRIHLKDIKVPELTK